MQKQLKSEQSSDSAQEIINVVREGGQEGQKPIAHKWPHSMPMSQASL